MVGTLYIIGTPIGNLEDMSFRGVRILKEVDLIGCEDTRNASKLLNHYKIESKLFSYHKYNEKEREKYIVDLLIEGKNVGIISDAGMPLISDPGYFIVKRVLEEKIPISVVPGPTALTSALAVSGLKTDRFYFYGFLNLERERDSRRDLEYLLKVKGVHIFYISPHKLLKELRFLKSVYGNRSCSLLRELTKIYEENIMMPLDDLIIRIEKKPLKGEIVLLIENDFKDEKIELSFPELEKKAKEIPGDLKKKELIKVLKEIYTFNAKEFYNYLVKGEKDV